MCSWNRNENIAGIRNRRFEFECEDVFECLLELLEDAFEDENGHRCRRACRECRRCRNW